MKTLEDRLAVLEATTTRLRIVAYSVIGFMAICFSQKAEVAAADDDSGWIEWDRSSEHVVSRSEDQGAAYPRCRALSNGDILLSYHFGESLGHFGTRVAIRKSRDGGKAWYSTNEVDTPEPNDFWGFTNPDFVEIGKGVVLLASAARGRAEPGKPVFSSECERSEIRLRVSDDFGETWKPPTTVARGRGRLWEPCLVKLPGKALELYYANEAPELANRDDLRQRIEVLRSADNGKTWGQPTVVSYRHGMRNGMPSAISLKGGKVAIAQEIVGDPVSPWIYTTFNGRPVPNSEYSCQRDYGFGGAPFLLGTPSGDTLLAFHSNRGVAAAPSNAKIPWMFATIYIQKGGSEARGFGIASRPWPDLDGRTGAFYPTIMMKSQHTVVVLASFITQATDGSSRTEVRWIEGTLKPKAKRR